MSHPLEKSVIVTVTGAAGRIAYSLIPPILNGNIFGHHCGIHLRLLDIPEAEGRLHGVRMEIEDSYYPLLQSLVATTSPKEAFRNCEVAILIGGFPRLPGMERRDLLIKNAQSIRSQALALNEFGNREAKVLVVANPANTNCLVAIHSAPDIPARNFTCLTRLDQERLRGFCAKRMSNALQQPVHSHDVHKVYILGNHSTTQVAFIDDGELVENDLLPVKVKDYFSEEDYSEVLHRVQNRGAEIIKAMQVSSALSAAEAIVSHLKDWLGPEIPKYPFSMGVLSNGNTYGIPENIVYSVPCIRSDQSHGYSALTELNFNAKIQILMKNTADELLNERSQLGDYIQS
jgi:malate dehydrogenase